MKPIMFGLLLFAAALPSQATTITGRVVKVSDGDTITVLEDTTQHKIRLMGIDAPEPTWNIVNNQKVDGY